MASDKILLCILVISLTDASNIAKEDNFSNSTKDSKSLKFDIFPRPPTDEEASLERVFNGVYSECILQLSYICLQKKTLQYLEDLNELTEVSIFGNYVKFVKSNNTINVDEKSSREENGLEEDDSENITRSIDKLINNFFENHILKISAAGRDLYVPATVDHFIGRKKKGGGGDGGKKKMMMMALMCMKMKFMMMMPAMMGMMGMMSFKGMMFSMMSFIMAKIMLLMKIFEKKGSSGGDSGGWSSGGGGGSWTPSGGGGYDSSGQWQSRSIPENLPEELVFTEYPFKPTASHITSQDNARRKDKISLNKSVTKKSAMDDFGKLHENNFQKTLKSRKKRGVMDIVKNTNAYWLKPFPGEKVNKWNSNIPKYKFVDGLMYVYTPHRN